MTHILVVEDDPVLSDGLSHTLRQGGYVVDCVSSGDRADHLLTAHEYDLAILDLELPGLDGFEVLHRFRERQGRAPVLILTARDGLRDRIRGLDLGADDYVVKPFEMEELEARVRALVRRAQGAADNTLHVGRLSLDVKGRRALLDGEPIELSAHELAVLEMLMMRAGHVVNKNALMDSIYDWHDDVGPNAIEVYVHRIRKKLEGAGVIIRTVRGLGYLLDDCHVRPAE